MSVAQDGDGASGVKGVLPKPVTRNAKTAASY